MSMSRVASMDSISLDDDWEILLPDHKSSFCMDAECSNGNHGVVGGGGKDQLLLGAELVVIDMDHFGPTPTASFRPPPYDCSILDEEAKKPLLLQPSEDAYVGDPPTADYYKDIDVVAAEPKPEREDLVSEVTEILVYEAEEQEETIKSVIESDQNDDVLVEAAAPDGVSQCVREEKEEEEEGVGKTGFGVGSLLRVNGVGALCSFGVAAATFCIMLLGGKQQQLQKRQANKIQLQHMYPAGDEMIQQVVVVQQASMMNQTMSSVMGGASSARASVSFGGYYQGF